MQAPPQTGVVTSAADVGRFARLNAETFADALGPAITRVVDREVRRRSVFGGPQEF